MPLAGQAKTDWGYEYRRRPEVRLQLATNQRAHRARMRAYLHEAKLARGCADCGYKQHAEALDFDHVTEPRNGGRTLAEISRWSWEDLKAEVEKCDVVCANCHRVRTHERGR